MNPACATQSVVVPDLINGQEYIFRVRAENLFGFGPFVETTEGTRAKDPIRTSEFSLVTCFTASFTDLNEKKNFFIFNKNVYVFEVFRILFLI